MYIQQSKLAMKEGTFLIDASGDRSRTLLAGFIQFRIAFGIGKLLINDLPS